MSPETHETQSPGALLADDMYAKVETPEVETPVEQKVETPEVEKPVEPEVENPEVDAAESEEVELSTIEELAEHLETEPDWIRGLKITEKVNGKPVEVSISDALSTHRKVAAGDDYLADAKTKAKAILSESEQQKEVMAANAATLGALVKEIEEGIEKDVSDTNWAQLRRDDPAEYSAKKEELRERRDRIENMKQRAADSYKNANTQLSEQQKNEREAKLPQEREALLQKVPEWNDAEVASKEQSEFVEWLRGDGVTDAQISDIAYNGKLMGRLVQAMRYDKSQGKIEAAKKKVVKIPKVLKPGKPVTDQKPTGGEDRVSILYGES